MQVSSTDPNAFKRMLSYVRKITNKLTRDSDCDDIVQDVMVKILTSPSVPPVITGTWLSAVVHRTYFDHCRALSRRRTDYYVIVGEPENYTETDDNPYFTPAACDPKYDSFDTYDLVLSLESAISFISPAQLQPLLLYAQGHTYNEIATLTDTALGTVRSRIHHARKRCREVLSHIS